LTTLCIDYLLQNLLREFFELWPNDVDIVFSPMEVGNHTL